MSPFLVLLIGVVFIVVAIGVLKIHPFFSLILAAIFVGIIAHEPEWAQDDKLPQATLAIQRTMEAFGSLAGKIGVVIAMAAVIGQALMESGAADKITRRLLGILQEKRANYALMGSGYILSVPVFFDTVFFLLIPLARALRLRTGKNYLIYIMAICAGGVLTHGLVPPTPGPLVMASEKYLNIPLGQAILGGFLLGLPVAWVAGILLPKLMVKWIDLPMRDAPGTTTAELEAIVNKPESELPGFLVSILPVALPVVLITAHSIVEAFYQYYEVQPGDLPSVLVSTFKVTSFLGDKHFALGLGTALALWLLARQKKYSMQQMMQSLEPALMMAGTIILITCAGGSFGSMLKDIGLGDAIREMLVGYDRPEVLILVAFGIAAVMKIAQGSGTVSMITASAIMAAILKSGVELPYHKIYIFAAIAFGSTFISWMNDSGFWVVCKMSGFTERETLKTWTVQLAVISVLGLIEVLILSRLLPLV